MIHFVTPSFFRSTAIFLLLNFSLFLDVIQILYFFFLSLFILILPFFLFFLSLIILLWLFVFFNIFPFFSFFYFFSFFHIFFLLFCCHNLFRMHQRDLCSILPRFISSYPSNPYGWQMMKMCLDSKEMLMSCSLRAIDNQFT